MNNPNIYDGETTRPMTEQEYSQWQTDVLDAELSAQAQTAKESARQALLERLGITAEEAQLLLGGI
jgi:hypothetical protein